MANDKFDMLRLLKHLCFYYCCWGTCAFLDVMSAHLIHFMSNGSDDRIKSGVSAEVAALVSPSVEKPPAHKECEENNEMEEQYDETCDNQQQKIRYPQDEDQSMKHCSSKLPQPPSSCVQRTLTSMWQAQQQRHVNEDWVKTSEKANKLPTNPVLARKRGKEKANSSNHSRTSRKKRARLLKNYTVHRYFKSENNPLLKDHTILPRNFKRSAALRKKNTALSSNNLTILNYFKKMPRNQCPRKEVASVPIRACFRIGCKNCTPMKKDRNIRSTASEYVHEINYRYTCANSDVVYMLECSHCRKQYIGETGMQISERMSKHRYDIARKRNTSVAKHFNELNHNFHEAKIYILQSGLRFPEERKHRESYFILKFNTEQPAGINAPKRTAKVICAKKKNKI